MKVTESPGYLSRRITTIATTTIRASGRTLIHALVIGATAAGTVSIQDGAGTDLVVFKTSMPEGVYLLDILANGLKVVTAAASDITVIYQ